MSAFLGQSIYCKQDMVGWLLEGIVNNFPTDTELVFYFEVCTDLSIENFDRLAPTVLKDYRWSKYAGDRHILEHGAHRFFIERFMESPHDVLVVPQDDTKFLRPCLNETQQVINTYGDRLGFIGCRDGYDFGHANFVSSCFSDSDLAKNKLPHGQHAPRRMLNTGPNIYTKNVVNKIGLPDPDLQWCNFDDYCLRAEQAGLTNVLLSLDVEHRKFGQFQFNHDLYNPQQVAGDLQKFRNKWRAVYGQNPL